MNTATYIGIDVAKDKVNVCWLPQNKRVEVQEIDYPKLVEDIKASAPELIVMEATGGYQRTIQSLLAECELPVAVVNPARVRFFAKALGTEAKTDDIDAWVLALYAQKMHPRTNLSGPKVPDEIREYLARRRQLTGMRTMEANRRHRARDRLVLKGLKDTLALFDKQIATIDAAIDEFFKSSPEWNEKREILESVPGVGELTANALLAELPELGTLSKRKISSLAGLAPMNNDSARFHGTRSIRGGRTVVRSALYMACMSAVRHNPPIRTYFERLRGKGKKYKVSITACMRKLLIILNTMMREKTTFSPRIT